MEVLPLLNSFTQPLIDYWRSLGPAALYYLWLSSGLVGFLLLLFISHRVMRKLLGHRKFRGTWYNEMQFQELINILDEDQASGRRVMQHDEIVVLRQWKYGMQKGIGFDKSDGYYMKR